MNNKLSYWLGVAGVEINIKLFVFNSSFTLTEIPEETASRIELNKQLEHKEPFEVLFHDNTVTVVFVFSERELSDLSKLSCAVTAESPPKEKTHLVMRMGKILRAGEVTKNDIGRSVWIEGKVNSVDECDTRLPLKVDDFWVNRDIRVMLYED